MQQTTKTDLRLVFYVFVFRMF